MKLQSPGCIFQNGCIENFHFALTLLSSDLIGESICEESARKTIGLDRNEYKREKLNIDLATAMKCNGK